MIKIMGSRFKHKNKRRVDTATYPVVPEPFPLVDIAFVDLVVPLVVVQITTTMEPSGSSRRNKSLSRALASRERCSTKT